MSNEELVKALRGHIREVPLSLLRDAADALEAAEKRIADLETALKACRVQRGEKYE